MASDFTRRLDDDEKGTHSARTPGGSQEVTIISESGLYVAVIGSQAEGARAFKRWVTHEVIPTIRRTGGYPAASPTPALPQSYADALRELAASVEARDALAAEVGTLTPRAEAWDELAEAGTDYAVADAASILKRAGIDTGPQRLFETLGEIRWTYRGEGKRWRPYATALDAGYLTERAMPPRLNSDGDLVPTVPQVRVTARGLERLRVRLGVLTEVAS
jgi:phage antirepressor YoqD-like protein